MSFNTFGKMFRFTTWGESHGPAIGCVVDGCPPNIILSERDIQIDMDKRRPGKSKFTSQRKESDKVEILSGVFQGKVIVSQDAQKTDAFQFNQNLLLSENADVNSKPELEIYADDVKCSHGSTTGDLDEEMLFYLRSRGLNKQQAKKILIEGFINELFDEIKNEEIKENLLKTSKEII